LVETLVEALVLGREDEDEDDEDDEAAAGTAGSGFFAAVFFDAWFTVEVFRGAGNASGSLFFLFLRRSRSLRRFLSRFSGDVKRLRFALAGCASSSSRLLFFFFAVFFLDAFALLFFFAALLGVDGARLTAVSSIAFLAFFFTRLRRTTGKNIHANFFMVGSFVTFGKAPVARVTRARRGAAAVPLIGHGRYYNHGTLNIIEPRLKKSKNVFFFNQILHSRFNGM
jgi:hypothetical protein